MKDAKNLLAEIEQIENETKRRMLNGGSSHADLQFLFIKTELLCEQGLADFPEETYAFASRRAHARAGAEMIDRHAREVRLEKHGIETEHAEETEIDALSAKLNFLRAIIADLDKALTVLPDHPRLLHEMNTVVRAMISAVAEIKMLEDAK